MKTAAMVGAVVFALLPAVTICGINDKLNAALANKASASTRKEQYQFCIVGAGPAGLQLGHLLHTAGRDYTILEMNAGAGSFYERFPRHRKLISLNKRFTGRTDNEFNLRHGEAPPSTTLYILYTSK